MEPCCELPENREVQPADPNRPGVTISVCRICQRRHIRMAADPVLIKTRS